MIEFIVQHSGVISLIGFFSFFGVAAAWALLPSNKKRFDNYKNIPLEEQNGKQ